MKTIKRSDILHILNELLLRGGAELPVEARVRNSYREAGFAVLIPKGDPIECEFWMLVGENLSRDEAHDLVVTCEVDNGADTDSEVCLHFPGVILTDDARG